MSISDTHLYIIAEVANAAQGVVENNHLIIDEVASTGADAIKFQFYKYDELATPKYEKYDNFRKTFYTEEERLSFIDHASDTGLEVLIDVFDRWGLGVVQKRLDKVQAVKIPPAVFLDEELVKKILDLGKPTLIGVGGYEDEDIDFLLSKLKGTNNLIILIHGFQGFPTDEKDSSLARINYLKKKYSFAVGYADHIDAESELALRLPEYAFFVGASVIEKHITLDRSAKGLDYYSSLLPDEFATMVKNLRRCVVILGGDVPTSSEKGYLKHSTRITTVRNITAGEILFRRDVKFRRTDNRYAMFPNRWHDLKPAVALRDLDSDVGVTEDDVQQAVIGTIVGCRMHSTRLPKKALLEINSVPSIERCLINAMASRRSQKTILATSTHRDDTVLANYTLDGNVLFFRGAETDLVARFLDAAEELSVDIIVRVTGDRPLISPELIDFLVDEHIKAGADFSYFKNVPLGINPEIINTPSLRRLKTLISTEDYSEYLTLFFKNNPDYFKLNEVEPPVEFRHPEYRMVLDYPEDLEMFRAIFGRLGVVREPVPLQEVLDLLKRQPKIAEINSQIKAKYVDSEFADFLNRVTTIRKTTEQ